jgi:hypothetical protein
MNRYVIRARLVPSHRTLNWVRIYHWGGPGQCWFAYPGSATVMDKRQADVESVRALDLERNSINYVTRVEEVP